MLARKSPLQVGHLAVQQHVACSELASTPSKKGRERPTELRQFSPTTGGHLLCPFRFPCKPTQERAIHTKMFRGRTWGPGHLVWLRYWTALRHGRVGSLVSHKWEPTCSSKKTAALFSQSRGRNFKDKPHRNKSTHKQDTINGHILTSSMNWPGKKRKESNTLLGFARTRGTS